jgi:hypothetical protein
MLYYLGMTYKYNKQTPVCKTKLKLSYSFRCDQVYDICSNEFGHILLCYLSLTYKYNKQFLKQSSSLATALDETKFITFVAARVA